MLASAASVFLVGCDDDDDTYAYTHTRGGYYGDEPVLVERRSVVIDNTPRYVPIYRTGRSYYYTYNGRRFDYDYDGPVTTRTRTYRTSDADYVDNRRVVSRTVVRDDDDERVAYRTRRVVSTNPEPIAEGTRVRVGDDGYATVRVRDDD